MPFFDWDSHKIFFRQKGNGPLLLVLPGNTASSAYHQGELEYFSDRYCATSLDFLGTGQSDRVLIWAEDWWAQGADQANALVEHLGFPDCVVLGTSGGAVIALRMAFQHPEKVRAVIADSFTERFSMEMARNADRERKLRTAGQIQFWANAHGPDWEQVIEADTAMLLRLAEAGGEWLAGRVSEIRCPVLLTASKEDTILLEPGQHLLRMSEKIADCRTFLNNRGGHPLMWSAPKDFRAISDYFLKTIDG